MMIMLYENEEEYDLNDGDNRSGEVPAVRAPVDEADGGSPEGVSELQTNALGHAKQVGSAGQIDFFETEDGQFVKTGYMWSIWNAPSDRDYYDQFGSRWPDEPELCHDCGALLEDSQPHEPWCPASLRPAAEPAPSEESK